MPHLEDITRADLHDALKQVEGAKPAQRLVAAIAYKSGVTQSELADWFGVERKTIYNWLTRLEAGDLLEAATDEPRPGRSRKLSGRELAEFRDLLAGTPETVGFETTAWTPQLVQRVLRAEFDVEYSIPSCRRLMKEAGLRYVPADRKPGTVEAGGGGDRRGEDTGPARGGFWTTE